MLKVGICDDENDFILKLSGYLANYSDRRQLEMDIRSFKNAQELYESMEEDGTLDIIFLDIELKETSGVEVGKKLRSELKNEVMQIVFVSSKEGYAMQLFDIRPMNFLIKPVDYEKVAYILNEYERLYCYRKNFFAFHIGKSEYKLCEEAILYFQSQGKKIQIVTQNDRKEFYGKLSDILLRLKDKNFCMVHKSYLINMRYVVEYKKDIVVMANGETIPVSRSMRNNLNMKLLENT